MSLVQLVSLAAIVVSVLLLALQTRELAKQTRVANSLAGASTLAAQSAQLATALVALVEHPELRPHFYSGLPSPSDPATQSRIATIAELFADAIESSLQASGLVESFAGNDSDWRSYAAGHCRSSPAVEQVVRDHAGWYPLMAEVLVQLSEHRQR